MGKDITDDIRALSDEDVSVSCKLDNEALRRVKARTFEKTGIKKSEGNRNMKKKLSWKAISAIAACVCLLLCAAAVLPGILKQEEKVPGGVVPGGVPGIRSEFVGLRELKATVANNDYKDGKVMLIATTETDRSVEQQAREFEALGFETSIAADGSLYLYTTKDAIAQLELPEKLQFTHFRITYEGEVPHIN